MRSVYGKPVHHDCDGKLGSGVDARLTEKLSRAKRTRHEAVAIRFGRRAFVNGKLPSVKIL
jgi:hypothetical protein